MFSSKKLMGTIEIPVREAINQAIDEEMARDEKVFVIGDLSFRLKTSKIS